MSADPRFSSMHTAPIFKKTRIENKKVKLDDRFKAVLTDDRFRTAPGQVDRYGRKKKGKKTAESELNTFYEIDGDVEGRSPSDDIDNAVSSSSFTRKIKDHSKDDLKFKTSAEDRIDFLNRMARGEISDATSSDGDVDECDDASSTGLAERVELDDDIEYHDGAFDAIAGEEVPTGDASKRLAIQNCDWENLKAEDVMVVLQSFCPTGKSIVGVTIYQSDYGKEKMEEEAKFGPQGIWTASSKAVSSKKRNGNVVDDDLSDDEEEEEEDQYHDADSEEGYDDEEQEEEVGGDEERDVDEEQCVGESNDEEEASSSSRRKAQKGYGDFMRSPGHVGVVFQNSDGNDDDNGTSRRRPSGRGRVDIEGTRKKGGTDFDPDALRSYELQKLRYYFAIAECDSVQTADALYNELDGVELESSSMVFDLRFVPDDISFEDRLQKSSCRAADLSLHNYKPPDFIVQALQHTNVECSWDDGEREREKKLTNFSSWKQLKDSDLQQYIASSDSSEEEEEEDKASKKKKAARLRSLLVGDGDETGLGGTGGKGSSAAAAGDDDDFFVYDDNDDDDDDDDAGGDGGDDPESGDMVLTYVPELGKDLLDKKRAKSLTPFEQQLQQLAEKKKARKLAKKMKKSGRQAVVGGDDDDDCDDDEVDDTVIVKKDKREDKGKGKASGRKAKDSVPAADSDDDAAEYDMRAIVQEEKLRARGSKRSKRKLQELASQKSGTEDFSINLQDERFSALLDGDARFGLDPTSNEFKETPAMKKILKEQRTRRTGGGGGDAEFGQSQQGMGGRHGTGDGSHSGLAGEATTPHSGLFSDSDKKLSLSDAGQKAELSKSLANKLKRKFIASSK